MHLLLFNIFAIVLVSYILKLVTGSLKVILTCNIFTVAFRLSACTTVTNSNSDAYICKVHIVTWWEGRN